MLRSFLVVSLLLCFIPASIGQLDKANTEGSSLPEVLPETVSGPEAQRVFPGPAPTAYCVIAVESSSDQRHDNHNGRSGGPEASNSGDSSAGLGRSRSSSPSRSDSSKGRSNGASSGFDSGSADSSSRIRSSSPYDSAEPNPSTDLGGVVRPASNPAANAPLASATPLFGAPAAGTVIPGRYVVFFHKNVSSTKVGLNRWVVFGTVAAYMTKPNASSSNSCTLQVHA